LARWKWRGGPRALQPHVVREMIAAQVAPCTMHLDKGFVHAELPPGVTACIPQTVVEEEQEQEDDEMDWDTMEEQSNNRDNNNNHEVADEDNEPAVNHSLKISLGRISVEHFFGNIKTWDKIGKRLQNKCLQFFYQYVICCTIFKYKMLL
jgi:hypothetical protein